MSNKTFAALAARLAATPEYTAESVAVAFMVDINARMLGPRHQQCRAGAADGHHAQLYHAAVSGQRQPVGTDHDAAGGCGRLLGAGAG